jgi:hypothetical protein
MKLGITTLLVYTLLHQFAIGQTKLPIDEKGNIKFDSVVYVDSSQPSQLYNKALYWFGVNFKSPRDAIKMQIPESHTIIANGITHLEWPLLTGKTSSKLGFKITISCKDNKYKYSIEDLIYYDYNYRPYPDLIRLTSKSKSKGAEKARQNVLHSIEELVSGLYKEMTKKENW